MVHLSSCLSTLCLNFFFPVCVSVCPSFCCVFHFLCTWQGNHSPVCSLRTSHLLLKAEDSLSWCQIVVLTVVVKFSSPRSVFCFLRNLFGFKPDSPLCRCFQIVTDLWREISEEKEICEERFHLPASLSTQKEDPQLIYKLHSVWNLFKVLVLNNL